MNIRFENVFFSYENFSLPANASPSRLQDLSFAIRPGEVIGIVGRSGSGKTTLLQLFNGLLLPERGRVLIDEADIHAADYDLVALRRRLGVVFQFPEIQLFAATVEEEIAFGLQRQNFDAEEISNRVTKALHAVGLDESFASRNPFTLSQGEKRRVALASVFVMQPETLILDEPTAGLDARGIAEILALLQNFHTAAKTLIIISHDVDLLASHCSRVLVLDQGRLLYDGTTRQLWGDENNASRQEVLQKVNLPLPRYQRVRRQLREKGYDWRGLPILKDSF